MHDYAPPDGLLYRLADYTVHVACLVLALLVVFHPF